MLPAAFPNLLANGAQGIAVGMATSIPPHNIVELCDAALHLIVHPEAENPELVRFVQGPDFPTGGVCVEDAASIAESYRTGRGSFRLRARWAVEQGERGAWSIVVTEVPYGVQKSRADRAAGRGHQREEDAAGRRRPRRIGRGRARRHRAAQPLGRGGRHDGAPVPADRARSARAAQHERAGGRRRAARGGAEGGPAAVARPSPRRPGAAVAPSAGRNRAAARAAGRHAGRLPQPRRGDPHRPRGG